MNKACVIIHPTIHIYALPDRWVWYCNITMREKYLIHYLYTIFDILFDNYLFK